MQVDSGCYGHDMNYCVDRILRSIKPGCDCGNQRCTTLQRLEEEKTSSSSTSSSSEPSDYSLYVCKTKLKRNLKQTLRVRKTSGSIAKPDRNSKRIRKSQEQE